MKKNNLTIIIVIIFTTFLYSCQSLNDAIAGKKRSEQSDEFLVEKKNPLVLPPDFNKLPAPGSEEVISEPSDAKDEIKDLLSIKDENKLDSNKDDSNDLENSILKKIQ